ncbi:MAG: hypothetical protein ACRDT1_06095 [Micromonosporaceae bacterium]
MGTITEVSTWEGFADRADEMARSRGGRASLRTSDRLVLIHPSGEPIWAYRHTDPEQVEVAAGRLVDVSRISHQRGLDVVAGIMDGRATEVALIDGEDRWVGAEWSVDYRGGSVRGGGTWDEDQPEVMRSFVRQLAAWS